jgi:hypothetical protein
MRKIDPDKLSKELKDILIHRECVQRSGLMMATYLKEKQMGGDSTSLIARCQTHDLSKMNNLEEFLSLASIVDQIDDMQDIHHIHTHEQSRSIELHWSNNKHHPEYYDDPNDMCNLDIIEMVCDCHARSKQFGTEGSAPFLEAKNKSKYHFDIDHYDKVMKSAEIMDNLAKDDDYHDIITQDLNVGFNFDDRMVSCLENFNIDVFKECICTDRMVMIRKMDTDFATISYELRTKDNENNMIGFINIRAYGELNFKIYTKYKEQGFLLEGLTGLLSICDMNYLYAKVKKTNDTAQRNLELLGFERHDFNETTYKYINNNLNDVKRLCLK